MSDFDFQATPARSRPKPPTPPRNGLLLLTLGAVALLVVLGVTVWLVTREIRNGSPIAVVQIDASQPTQTQQSPLTKRTQPTGIVKPVDPDAEQKKAEMEKVRQAAEKKRKYREKTDKYLILKGGRELEILTRWRDRIEEGVFALKEVAPIERHLFRINVNGLMNEYLFGLIVEDAGAEATEFATAMKIGDEERQRKIRFAYWFYEGEAQQVLKEIAEAARKHGGFKEIPGGYKAEFSKPQYTLIRSAMLD